MEQESLFEEGEVVFEKVRKHYIVYVGDFLTFGIGGTLFSLGAITLSQSSLFPASLHFITANISLVLIGFVMLCWSSFFYLWTKSYFDVWYVTNKHIIAINQKQIFDREEAFMELNRIQDVFFEKNTFLGTFLGYGKLKVQSAGTEQVFVIDDVFDVERVAHKIMELRDGAKQV